MFLFYKFFFNDCRKTEQVKSSEP